MHCVLKRMYSFFAIMIIVGLARKSTAFGPMATRTLVLRNGLHPTKGLLRGLCAAPGCDVASKDDLKAALANPETVVVDVRGVDEIQASGYWKTSTRWVHAPGSKVENGLLSVAADALIPDKSTPVIVHCAAGLRAAKAKEILEEQGYEKVYNAGGYPGDMIGL